MINGMHFSSVSLISHAKIADVEKVYDNKDIKMNNES